MDIEKRTKKFIERANKVHGKKYDYSHVEYESAHKKVKIKCKLHGLFEQTPDSHVRNHGCKECNGGGVLTKISFIEKAKKIHGDKYGYLKVNYKNNRNKVSIYCSFHGQFLQSPAEHLSGYGCWECGVFKRANDKMINAKKEFIEKANKIHNNKYNYLQTIYAGSRKKIKIICKKHGQFSQRANSHLMGYGCPYCCESKGEERIKKYLDENKINYCRQKRFDDCRNIRPLPFDFYLPSLNLCIEYDGEQHFKEKSFSSSNKEFENNRKKDEIKNNYCNKKGRPNLIRINFLQYNEIEKILNFL